MLIDFYLLPCSGPLDPTLQFNFVLLYVYICIKLTRVGGAMLIIK